MTVTRKVTWFTGSLILLVLATAAAKTWASGGVDCPHSKPTITDTQQGKPVIEGQKPAKAAPAQSPVPAEKKAPAEDKPQKPEPAAPA
jgi:hypothetical protein